MEYAKANLYAEFYTAGPKPVTEATTLADPRQTLREHLNMTYAIDSMITTPRTREDFPSIHHKHGIPITPTRSLLPSQIVHDKQHDPSREKEQTTTKSLTEPWLTNRYPGQRDKTNEQHKTPTRSSGQYDTTRCHNHVLAQHESMPGKISECMASDNNNKIGNLRHALRKRTETARLIGRCHIPNRTHPVLHPPITMVTTKHSFPNTHAKTATKRYAKGKSAGARLASSEPTA